MKEEGRNRFITLVRQEKWSPALPSVDGQVGFSEAAVLPEKKGGRQDSEEKRKKEKREKEEER